MNRFVWSWLEKNSLFRWTSEQRMIVCIVLICFKKVHTYSEFHYFSELNLSHNLYLKMQVHPGKKIQEELKDRGWTQRQFAFLLWKKVSEVNELIKWKRNITVQRDILLSHVLWTSRKYRLDLQNEYDYNLFESDFDISKLPNIEDNAWSTTTKSEEKWNIKLDSGHSLATTSEWQKFEPEKKLEAPKKVEAELKKDTKRASQYSADSNKPHKINLPVEAQGKQEKPSEKSHQNKLQEHKNNSKSEKNIHNKSENLNKSSVSSFHSSPAPLQKEPNLEWPKKLEPKKEIWLDKQDIKNSQKLDSGHKITSPEWQSKTNHETIKQWNNNKHKEHIFRNF